LWRYWRAIWESLKQSERLKYHNENWNIRITTQIRTKPYHICQLGEKTTIVKIILYQFWGWEKCICVTIFSGLIEALIDMGLLQIAEGLTKANVRPCYPFILSWYILNSTCPEIQIDNRALQINKICDICWQN
jgi:hypothetical protein